MTSAESEAPQLSERFEQLENYPWDSDEEFQQGLRAILGSSSTAEQAEHLTLRARCYYYARKFNVPIDFQSYQDWRSKHGGSIGAGGHGRGESPAIPSTSQPMSTAPSGEQSSADDGSEHKPPYPMTFNHIVELITNGKPVPGVREIPNTLLEGQASEAKQEKRKKPWEVVNEQPTSLQQQ